MAAFRFNDPELLENLDNLESQVIAYESGLAQGQEDTSRVQFIFRYAHNLKSSLGMLGFSDSSALLHRVESCFDLVRNAKRRASLDLTKATLTVVDLVRDNLEADEGTPFPDVTAVGEVLEAFLSGLGVGTGEDLSVDLPFSLGWFEACEAYRAVRSGARLWVIDKLITTNIDESVFGILPCFDQARALGTLVAFWPTWDRLPKDKSEFVLRLLVASTHDKEEFTKKIHDSFRPVREPAVQRVYLPQEVPGEFTAHLGAHGFRPVEVVPEKGPAVVVVGLSGQTLASKGGLRIPGVQILAIGEFTCGATERLAGLDAGADTVVTDGLDLVRELERLETALYTGMGGAYER